MLAIDEKKNGGKIILKSFILIERTFIFTKESSHMGTRTQRIM